MKFISFETLAKDGAPLLYYLNPQHVTAVKSNPYPANKYEAFSIEKINGEIIPVSLEVAQNVINEMKGIEEE